jgi:hypothetical protein
LEHLHVEAEVRVSVHRDHCAAGERDHVRVSHEVRVGGNDLVPGVDDREQGQEQSAAGAAGDQNVAVLAGEAGVHVGEQLRAQLRDALGDGVPVLVGVDGRFGRGLDRVRDREVRLADAQVNGVLERLAQFEHLAHAGHFDRPRPGRQQRFGKHAHTSKNFTAEDAEAAE